MGDRRSRVWRRVGAVLRIIAAAAIASAAATPGPGTMLDSLNELARRRAVIARHVSELEVLVVAAARRRDNMRRKHFAVALARARAQLQSLDGRTDSQYLPGGGTISILALPENRSPAGRHFSKTALISGLALIATEHSRTAAAFCLSPPKSSRLLRDFVAKVVADLRER
jgi:hypothetical protein